MNRIRITNAALHATAFCITVPDAAEEQQQQQAMNTPVVASSANRNRSSTQRKPARGIGGLMLAIAVVIAAFPVVLSAAADAPGRPNIIVVMADDMGFSDLGCYGGEIKTPTIDRLASEGVRFSQFYNCALCGPSRASLMTGCYPWEVGQAPGTSIFANLKKNCVTVMQLLKANGYETCAVGRLDMVTAGDWHEPADIAKCADRFLGSSSGGPGNYFKEAKGTPWFRDGRKWQRPEGAYSTDLISDFVAEFIEGTAAREKPFFIYVSHYAPHWPLQAEEADIAPYRELYQKQDRKALMQARLRRLIDAGLIPEGTTLPESMVKARPAAGGYLAVERMAIHAAMIESIDRSLADTMAALKKAGKLDNTLILVLSDNGASAQMIFDKGRPVPAGVRPGSVDTFLNHGPALAALSNTPFRNYKAADYEGGIAAPLIAWWPRGLKGKGRISHRLSHIADIMPTCLELADVSHPSQFQERNVIPLAGTSFVSVLRGAEAGQDAGRVLAWPKAVREGDWKLVMENAASPQLYHIGRDRNEKQNRAAELPERVRKMKEIHAKTRFRFSAAEHELRSLRVELPGQGNNQIKTSWPGAGTWFWTAHEFKPDGYKPFIDLYAKHTNLRLLMTSIRHPVWVDDPAVHDQIKAAASYARSNDMAMVMDLDVRLARRKFREQYPDELQEMVRLREVDLKEAGTISVSVEGINLGDHYTFRAPDYESLSGRLLRVYSCAASGGEVRDITDRCKVEQADGGTVSVSVPCSAGDRGRTACVMAAFTLFTPDVFAPHLPEFERSVLKQYGDTQLAGACKDEWGFPGRFNPSTGDLWYSESMAGAYVSRRPGHILARDLLLMFKGEKGREAERAAAINHYMQMYWQQNAKLEQHYYHAVKEVFGKQAVVATHPTWYPFPGRNEIFKNGLDWWAVKRDLAQTDESTPYCVRTALAKKCDSPLWYNMFYHRKVDAYQTELWQSVLGGGRLNYHQLFPFPDWVKNPEWNKALLKGALMQAEARIQLLNHISTKPIDCPVAVIFGHASALNWTGPGFAEVGLGITDKLWEAGYYADLIPSSEIAGGALKIGEDGSIRYGPQRYAVAVLCNPEYEQPTTADFFAKAAAGGKTKLFRVGSWSQDFEGAPFDGPAGLPATMKPVDANGAVRGVMEVLKLGGREPYATCTPNGAHYGSSMVPGVSGQIRLLDGTVIHASGKHDVMGDPIQKTFPVSGHEVTFDSVGIAAVRLDRGGRLAAMAAGGLKSFQGGGIEISMPTRADVALWKDGNGAWQGVLQGYQGPVPKNLASLCKNWARLKVPEPVR